MSIITSTSVAAAKRFTPKWLAGGPNPPVFFLRAGDVLEREMMQAELASDHRAGEIWPWDKQEAIVSGLNALGGESAEELTAIALAILGGEKPDASQRAIYDQSLALLAEHWPAYRILVAQEERRNALAPIVAFRRFCCGWENITDSRPSAEPNTIVPYSVGIDRLVDKAALSAIEPMALRAAGLEAYNLQWGLSAEKNSGSPSKSAEGQETSNSAGSSKAAGKSRVKNTRKTPA